MADATRYGMPKWMCRLIITEWACLFPPMVIIPVLLPLIRISGVRYGATGTARSGIILRHRLWVCVPAATAIIPASRPICLPAIAVPVTISPHLSLLLHRFPRVVLSETCVPAPARQKPRWLDMKGDGIDTSIGIYIIQAANLRLAACCVCCILTDVNLLAVDNVDAGNGLAGNAAAQQVIYHCFFVA